MRSQQTLRLRPLLDLTPEALQVEAIVPFRTRTVYLRLIERCSGRAPWCHSLCGDKKGCLPRAWCQRQGHNGHVLAVAGQTLDLAAAHPA